jgi:hypothetical protein
LPLVSASENAAEADPHPAEVATIGAALVSGTTVEVAEMTTNMHSDVAMTPTTKDRAVTVEVARAILISAAGNPGMTVEVHHPEPAITTGAATVLALVHAAVVGSVSVHRLPAAAIDLARGVRTVSIDMCQAVGQLLAKLVLPV